MESSSSYSMPLSSSSSSISYPIMNNENFNKLVKSKETFLITKYMNNQNMEITQLLSNILKDFYNVQENLLEYFSNNNIIDNTDPKEIINQILTEIFFNEPFDKYTSQFSRICKNSSNQYLTENILDGNKYSSFMDFLEKETFKTKIPNFINNLLIMFITDVENPEKRRNMTEEEKKRYKEKIKKNARKKIKFEDWNLEKIINLLDSPKEKERLKPILKEMEDDLLPKPSYFGLLRSEKKCKEQYKINLAKFNITAMNKFYLDLDKITICISGFLTENQEHFSGWKEFVRNNNEITFYYFLNWPSESKISSFLNFNQAKKRANYFGKILANMIVSEKFFKNKNITLVGHSLGCHFIKCCIKEIAENNDEDFKLNNKIEKIIFLGGATQIKNNKRWQNIFSTVTKGNVLNFYSNKDRALGLMETKLVWGKNSIGRNALLISGIDIQNYDCSKIKFEDFLNHGYKQIYGEIAKFFNF